MYLPSKIRLAFLFNSALLIGGLLAGCGSDSTTPVPEETRAQDSRVFTFSAYTSVSAKTFPAMDTASGDVIDMSTTSRWGGVLNGAAYRIEVPAAWNG
ncbi:MAG: hypothetical protein WA140_11375, partial [Geobacteraceae bacterium]